MTMSRSAVFSECRQYRYALYRYWDASKAAAMFIGLNPSTADETQDDPTVRRCIGYAQDWGYGGLIMTNIFAFRATDPNVMKAADEPIGAANDVWLQGLAGTAGVVVAAWGCNGTHLKRSDAVCMMLPDVLHYLRLTKRGYPQHPLYLPKTLTPTRWEEW